MYPEYQHSLKPFNEWNGMAWHGMAWNGMAWHGMEQNRIEQIISAGRDVQQSSSSTA